MKCEVHYDSTHRLLTYLQNEDTIPDINVETLENIISKLARGNQLVVIILLLSTYSTVIL